MLYFVLILSISNAYYELEKVLKICITFLGQNKAYAKGKSIEFEWAAGWSIAYSQEFGSYW